jgi:hypothetical protein
VEIGVDTNEKRRKLNEKRRNRLQLRALVMQHRRYSGEIR